VIIRQSSNSLKRFFNLKSCDEQKVFLSFLLMLFIVFRLSVNFICLLNQMDKSEASTSNEDPLDARSENDVTSLLDTSKSPDYKESSYNCTQNVDQVPNGRPAISYKQMTRDKVRMLKYLLKPIVMISFGVGLLIIGIILTVNHFLYEDSFDKNIRNPPYFTFGPVTFASGVVTFIFGIVWFSIKREKWLSGSASPILAAVAAAVSIQSTAVIIKKKPFV